jgi:hypothetical protein
VNLNVPREDFSQMLEQLRSVTILAVDQQVICIRQRLARPRFDRVWKEDDFGLVGGPAVLGDQVAIPMSSIRGWLLVSGRLPASAGVTEAA